MEGTRQHDTFLGDLTSGAISCPPYKRDLLGRADRHLNLLSLPPGGRFGQLGLGAPPGGRFGKIGPRAPPGG